MQVFESRGEEGIEVNALEYLVTLLSTNGTYRDPVSIKNQAVTV